MNKLPPEPKFFPYPELGCKHCKEYQRKLEKIETIADAACYDLRTKGSVKAAYEVLTRIASEAEKR
jgi:hypothetical protein